MVDKTKNFFALGLMYWMYNRPLDQSIKFIEEKFGVKDPEVAQANLRVLKAGFNYGETTEVFTTRYDVKRQSYLLGNTGVSWGIPPRPSDWPRQPAKQGWNYSSEATPSHRQAISCTNFPA